METNRYHENLKSQTIGLDEEQQKDLNESTTRDQTLTLFGVQIGSKLMQDKELDQTNPSLHNRTTGSTSVVQSEFVKRKLSSTNQGEGATIDEECSKKKKYHPMCLLDSLRRGKSLPQSSMQASSFLYTTPSTHIHQAHAEQHLQNQGSLFTDLEPHVAYRILRDQNYTRKLKVLSHGNKMRKRLVGFAQNQEFWQHILDSGLAPLIRSAHKTVDHELISAFIERWHPETSSFHLPFGEMTITLDDVSCLLHLPLTGIFFKTSITTNEAIELAVRYLGVSHAEATAECTVSQGPYYRFSWLQNIVRTGMQLEDQSIAVRAMILLILGMSIFTVKVGDRTEAKWLLLLDDISTVGRWAWGPATLAHLYNQMNFSSKDNITQLGGYATLFLSWILEYFPKLVARKPTGRTSGARCGRWKRLKTDTMKLKDYRQRIDALTPDDVVWRPFEDHREERPFDMRSLYRGFLTWGNVTVPYMPDRCLRQFGYIQVIPRDPLKGYPSHINIIIAANKYMDSVQELLLTTTPSNELGQVHPDYLPWYMRVSLPRLLPVAPPPLPPPVSPVAIPAMRGHAMILATVEKQLQRRIKTEDISDNRQVYRQFMRLLGLVESSHKGRE